MDFYIEDGVHRAVALRENGIQTAVPAILFQLGQPPCRIYVKLGELYSPKATISRIPDQRHNFPMMQAWLATPQGRAQMPPIHVQPLGDPGQTASVPLAMVQIVN